MPGRRAGRPLARQINAWAQQLEDAPVVLTALDHSSQYCEEGQVRYSQPIGPCGPLARLIHQRLADVEEHYLDGHASFLSTRACSYIVALILYHQGALVNFLVTALLIRT